MTLSISYSTSLACLSTRFFFLFFFFFCSLLHLAPHTLAHMFPFPFFYSPTHCACTPAHAFLSFVLPATTLHSHTRPHVSFSFFFRSLSHFTYTLDHAFLFPLSHLVLCVARMLANAFVAPCSHSVFHIARIFTMRSFFLLLNHYSTLSPYLPVHFFCLFSCYLLYHTHV